MSGTFLLGHPVYVQSNTTFYWVLDCTTIYILLIIDHNGDVSPEKNGTPQFMNPKVHYRTHNSPPFASIHSHINPVQAPPFHYLNICLNIILPYTIYKSYKWFLTSGFPIKIVYVFLFSFTGATCPARLVRLDLIARILLGDEHKSCGSSSCHFFQPTVTTNFLHLRSNHLPQHSSHQHRQPIFFHKCVRPQARTRTHTQQDTYTSEHPDFCVLDNKRDSAASQNSFCSQLLRAFQNIWICPHFQ